MSQMLTILVGFLLGYLVGSVFQFWKRFEQEHPSVFQPSFIEEELAAFSLIGIFLGWQSVLSIAMVATLLLIVLRCFRVNLKFLGISGAVFGVTIAHILLWRPTTSLNYWPSGDSNGLLITAFTVLLVVLIFTASKIRGHFAKESTPI